MKIDFDFINIKDFSFEEIRLVTTVSPPPPKYGISTNKLCYSTLDKTHHIYIWRT